MNKMDSEWFAAQENECGCKVMRLRREAHGKIERQEYYIKYCPKHEAAPAMYDALKEVVKAMGELAQDQEFMTAYPTLNHQINIALAAADKIGAPEDDADE
jgi:predicted component of type VI protein secretion system